MFSIGLSGRRWISKWPELQKEFTEISPNVSVTTIHKHTGEIVVRKAAMGKLDGDDEEPMSIQLRSTFHRTLFNQVRKLNIEIVYNKRAIDYTEDDQKAYVLTDDGQRASADVIIASDGIGSKAQSIVNGGKVEAKRSGTSMYRASCPPEFAMSDPDVLETFGLTEKQEAIVQVWMGSVERLTTPSYRDFTLTFDTDRIRMQ
jgi:2-polyprenyl-6-methoxyphenol hydroxylase-like FAD-dependent oxidoreductase